MEERVDWIGTLFLQPYSWCLQNIFYWASLPSVGKVIHNLRFIHLHFFFFLTVYGWAESLELISGLESSFSPDFWLFFLLFIYLFIHSFIHSFILGCAGSSVRARALSSCGKWGPLPIAVRGPLFIAVRGPLTIAAPPVAGHRLQTRRPSSCGSRTQPLRGMWDPPRPGPEPVSPALAGRFPTTAPPGKPHLHFLKCRKILEIESYKLVLKFTGPLLWVTVCLLLDIINITESFWCVYSQIASGWVF